MKKRKFIFQCLGFKYEFYADGWCEAEEIIMDMVEEEDREPTEQEVRDILSDERSKEYREAI